MQLSPRWTIGGKLDYTASNYAKTKDLRHKNSLLDLDINIGGLYHAGDYNAIGLELGYARRIESVLFKVYGNTDRQYSSLINFGSFIGNQELFTTGSADGYTIGEKPMVNMTKYATLIYEHDFSPAVQWYNAFTYGHRTGYFGIKASSSVVFTEHQSNQYAYSTVLSVKGLNMLHNITLSGSHERLNNDQNVYQEQTTTGDNTTIAYYGSNEILDQMLDKIHIDYEGFYKITQVQPLWKLHIGGDYFKRQQTTTLYPFYRNQTINSYNVFARGERNWVLATNMFTIGLKASYGKGSGSAKEDEQYSSNSATQTVPVSRDRYLNEEYEYWTKPHIQGSLDIKNTWSLGNKRSIYGMITYAYTKAMNVQYVGNHFNEVRLSIGYNF
ncbi:MULTISPECIES: DUF6850 family outer membrane beta-barrel protein [Chitinophagaceae]